MRFSLGDLHIFSLRVNVFWLNSRSASADSAPGVWGAEPVVPSNQDQRGGGKLETDFS